MYRHKKNCNNSIKSTQNTLLCESNLENILVNFFSKQTDKMDKIIELIKEGTHNISNLND